MIYGYARVSSIGQEKNGNSLEAQEEALRSRGCEVIYKEAYTGMTTDRPQFSALLRKLKEGDTLMVTKLDRFSRTAADGAKLVQELHEKGVIIDIINMGRADNTPMGKLMVTMLLAFAEFEHDQILERLNTGKAVAKAHGKRVCGRLPVEVPEFEKFLEKTKRGEATVSECCKQLGIGRTTWYKLASEVAI
jgi:DNA invertase Pin-like site-specific DNA recombinase